MTESFAELFEQSQQAISKLKPGAIVTGIVVEIRNDVVVINAGLKSEGIKAPRLERGFGQRCRRGSSSVDTHNRWADPHCANFPMRAVEQAFSHFWNQHD
jgi:hypothetical protein